MKDFTLHGSEATEGERLLMRIAGALEAGNMPADEDADALIDAVALVRVMVSAREKVEDRRDAFTRKLGMVKAPHRPARNVTAGDRLKGAKVPRDRARVFWHARAMGAGYNDALAEAMEFCCASQSSIRRAIKAHPEEKEIVLSLFREISRAHRLMTGEDHPSLEAAERILSSSPTK